jgi:ferredoxin
MANKYDKNPGNAPGAFYVDSTCIDCDLCRTTAPTTFQRNDDAGITVVYRQPVTAEEIALAREGMNGCPTDSIGCDGDGPA